MGVKLNTEIFISRSKEIYGDHKYDYSDSIYVNGHTPIKFKCNDCGDHMVVTPRRHLFQIVKCSCFVPNKPTLTSFCAKVKAKYGEDKYDLSLVNFVNMKTPIQIHCNDCGESFSVTPTKFIEGNKKCACFRTQTTLPMNTERFIAQAKELHGDVWDYSESVYVNNVTKIKIGCHKHGPFMMLPYNHIGGHNHNGCKICSGEILREERQVGNEEFIRRGRAKFGDKFGYDLVNYLNGEDKVDIVCPVHGNNKNESIFSHQVCIWL